MNNLIETDKLKEHHKNGYYFTDIEGEKYEEVKRSITENGIRDPIKVKQEYSPAGTEVYTVISGHQRLRIARDIGLKEIPAQVVTGLSDKDAEYLLIAENVERRGQAETDPIKKARIAAFLKEYWDIRSVGNNRSFDGHSVQQKTIGDIAEVLGESEKSVRRTMRLNDLIPQLQTLVSSGKLGTTAAEQLAYLTPEVQSALYETLGEEIADKTVKETQELRRDVDGKTPDEVVEQVKRDNERLKTELREKSAELLRTQAPKVEYKEVVKEVVPADVKRKISEIEKERDELDAALSKTYARLRDLEKLEKSVQHQAQSPLYDMYRSLMSVEGYLQVFTEDERMSGDLVANSDKEVVNKVNAVLNRVISHAQHAKSIVDNEDVTIINVQ